MLNYYQPWLWPFLHFQKTYLPEGIKRYYYHSFEDGLWELLIKKNVPQGALFLVPDFYCIDVLENIQKHGYRYQFYPLNKNFQIDESEFIDYLKKYQPAIVIIFHAAGISSRLMEQKRWLNYSKKMLIVEDCVHRLIDPRNVKLLGDNHYLVDSLRKVSPLPGSFLYGTQRGLEFTPTHEALFNTYALASFIYFWLFRLCLQLGMIFRNSGLVNFAHINLLKKHDDIIGDSLKPVRGVWIFERLSMYIDYEKLKRHKQKQVALYVKCFMPLWVNNNLYPFEIEKKDWSELHVFPVGFNRIPKNIIDRLHRKKIVVWFKFLDAPWSNKQQVLFLPLGLHVADKEIIYTAKTLSSYLSKTSL